MAMAQEQKRIGAAAAANATKLRKERRRLPVLCVILITVIPQTNTTSVKTQLFVP